PRSEHQLVRPPPYPPTTRPTSLVATASPRPAPRSPVGQRLVLLPRQLPAGPGNPSKRPAIREPAPHGRVQQLVQVAGHLAGPDPQGGRGVNALLVGGSDVHTAELHPLVRAHDRVGKRRAPLRFLLVGGQVDEVLLQGQAFRGPAPRLAELVPKV